MSDQKIPTVVLNVGAKASVPLNSPDSAIFAWYYSQMQDLYNQMVALLPSSFPIYTSLDQLNITVGQETLESIHNALPVNSMLILWVNQLRNSDMYPEGYSMGLLRVTKITPEGSCFEYVDRRDIGNGVQFVCTGNAFYFRSDDSSDVITTRAWSKWHKITVS